MRIVFSSILASIAFFVAFEVNALDVSTVGFGVVADSNPARAQFQDDMVSSSQASVGVGISLFSRPADESDGWGFFGSANLEFSAVNVEDAQSVDTGLGQNVLQLSLESERALTTLPGQPVMVIGATAGLVDSETDIRDSNTVGVSASLSYQPVPVLDFTIGLRHDERFSESIVFDTSKTQLFSSAFFGITPKLGLLAEAQLITGNEVSTATPTVGIVNQADAIVPDSAFGGFSDRRFAYLLDATSALGAFGVSYVVGNDFVVDGKFTYVFTDAGGGIDYSRALFSFAVNYNFGN